MKAGIILTRMDSQRLPQKAFLKIGNIKLVEYPIKALLREKFFIPIIATTDRPIDNPLADLAEKYNIKIFRGDFKNVSKRVIDCLNFFKIEEFARINGDSPFLQIDLLKKGYKLLIKNNLDFVTNLFPRSFPYGISVEIFRAKVYTEKMENIRNPFYQEHITSFFYDNIKNFNYANILFDGQEKSKDIHLTVDTAEDLEKIRKILAFDKNIFEKNTENIINAYKKIKFK